MIKQAVIVAAGMGVRLGHHTESQPKGFLRLHDFSLIERSILQLKQHGIEKIYIGTGYLSEFYERLAHADDSITCIKSDRYKTTGSMYTLFNMRHAVSGSFLLLESDLLYEHRALDYLLDDQRQDIVLGSGETLSNDEVYLQADDQGVLEKVSKNLDELRAVYAELVGINKISSRRYDLMNKCYEQVMQGSPKLDYESVMAMSSELQPFAIKKIDDLAWCEIDDEHHMARALKQVYPKIHSRDHEHKT